MLLLLGAPTAVPDVLVVSYLQFIADGVFYAELNELLTRELAEDGYSGVEVRVTPMRTEIIIRATRTQNVLGKQSSSASVASFSHSSRLIDSSSTTAAAAVMCGLWGSGGRLTGHLGLSRCISQAAWLYGSLAATALQQLQGGGEGQGLRSVCGGGGGHAAFTALGMSEAATSNHAAAEGVCSSWPCRPQQQPQLVVVEQASHMHTSSSADQDYQCLTTAVAVDSGGSGSRCEAPL